MLIKAITGQPKPFYTVFLIEIWERFGYYGVQALLVLYMVERLGLSDVYAYALFAAFTALANLLPALGGFIGDRVLGTKRTILFGAFVLATGYLLLSLPQLSSPHLLMIPLACIAVGNGLFKANPSSLLSRVYAEGNHNLDSGFTLYYMAVNTGSFLSLNAVPILNHYFGWHLAFSCCFVGLAMAIINFVAMRRSVSDFGSRPDQKPLRFDYFIYVVLFTLSLIAACLILLRFPHATSIFLSVSTLVLLFLYVLLICRASSEEKKGMFLFLILFIQAIIFYTLYFQLPTSLTLFAYRNVEHSILGMRMEPAQFQMLNPFWILTLSPILAAIYQFLHRRKKDLSLPTKFSLGTLLAGSAFLILPVASFFAHEGQVSGMWLVLSYGLQSFGELLVSALGLSLAARYVPQRFMGFTMGLWFVGPAMAGIIAGKVASFASIPETISHNPVLSLPIYNHLFIKIGLVTTLLALGMFVLVPLLKRLAIHDKQQAAETTSFLDELTDQA